MLALRLLLRELFRAATVSRHGRGARKGARAALMPAYSRDKVKHALRERGYFDGYAARPERRTEPEYRQGYRRGREQRDRDRAERAS